MIAITGGGTGGHLVIAKAIKEALAKKGIPCIYIGSNKGQDRQWFENDTDFKHTYFLKSQGVVNQKGFQKIITLIEIFTLAFTCKALFKKHHVRAVFSVGGYSAAPASIGALLTCKPLYIHEQNAITGKLNALLKPFAKAFFSSYDKKATYVDYPVRDLFFEQRRMRTSLKSIIFLGGSQGASFINALALSLAPFLAQKGIQIIHQTGNKEFESVSHFYASHRIDADVFAFSEIIEQKLSCADIAISRAGASTLWELCAGALPALFIPFPHAAANHQYYNAKTLVDKGLALMYTQESVPEPLVLLEILEHLNIASISEKLHHTISQGGAQTIAEKLFIHLKEKNNA